LEISNCQALEYPDLGGICGTGVEFRLIKNVMSKLKRLYAPVLPHSLRILPVDVINSDEWPSNLISITIGGLLNSKPMLQFSSPSSLRDLAFSVAKASQPTYVSTKPRVKRSTFSRMMKNLVYLSIPVDLAG
jgi:hypothetical protein